MLSPLKCDKPLCPYGSQIDFTDMDYEDTIAPVPMIGNLPVVLLDARVDAYSQNRENHTAGGAPMIIQRTIEYQAIHDYYGTRTAKRSGVPLMQHINEGIIILERIGADLVTQGAFCLHPLFQMDETFVNEAQAYMMRHGFTSSAFTAMEYRGIANAYLAHHAMPPDGIRLGPLLRVHQMLVADKVQNCKDFDLHHKGRHANSDRLTEYFDQWLDALEVTEGDYNRLISGL